MRILVFAAFAVAFAQPAAPSFNPHWGTLLPEEQAKKALVQCSRQTPSAESFWTPDQHVIRTLEPILARVLEREIAKQIVDPSRRRPALGYYRQYFGVVVNGQPLVYIDGFDEGHLRLLREANPGASDTWRSQAVNVCDGWTLFFGAEYDPTTGEVRNLRFNGRAG